MQFFIFGSFICYFFFLFGLYRLGKEDFTLIRKNVALEQLFNITFQATIIGLFLSRLIYVGIHFNKTYLNPLKFLVVFYFPGLIFPAILVGAYVYVWYLSRLHRSPSGRIIDFYSVSTAGIMPFLALLQLLLPGTNVIVQLIIAGVYIIIFFFFRFLLLPRVGRGEIKDGTLGFLYIGALSTVYFLLDAFSHTKGFFSFLQPEDVFYLVTLLCAILILCIYELKPTRKRKQKTI